MAYDAQSREKLLAHEPIGRLFFRFSVPAVVGMVVQALYNIVDRYFVAQLPEIGSVAIGGIGVSMPIFFLLFGFSMLFGVGGAASISIKLGQRDHPFAERILGNAVSLCFAVSLVLGVLFLWQIDGILRAFGASPENIGYARDYLGILLVGNLWNSLAFTFNHLIRAEGNPRIAMVSMLIGALSNMALDPLLMFTFALGIRGAAYATIIAQGLSFLWGASYYFRRKGLLRIRLTNMKPNLEVISRIVAIGISPFFIQIAGSLTGAIMNNSLRFFGGQMAQSAYAVINAIFSLFLMPIFGLNQSMQPIVGYNYGARDYKRVRRAVLVAIASATGFGLTGWLVMQLATAQVVHVMTDDAALAVLTRHGLKAMSSLIFIVGVQIVSSNFFQSIGKARITFLLSLSRQAIALFLLLLVLPPRLGLDGIWYSLPAADLLAMLVTAFFLIRELRRLGRQPSKLAEPSATYPAEPGWTAEP